MCTPWIRTAERSVMDYDAQRISDELRHKHIRTLELLRELIAENNRMRQKLNLGPSERWSDYYEGKESLKEEVNFLKRELQSSREKYAATNSEAERLREELRQAQSATQKAQATEEAHKLSLSALKACNKKLQEETTSLELRCRGQNERLEADFVQLRNQLASRVADAEEAKARAKLDISRLESEVQELRCNTSYAALSRNALVEEFNDDEASKTLSQVSQREIKSLQQSLRRATRRASTSQRRCIDLEQQAKGKARRRETAEHELQALQAVHLKASPLPLVHEQVLEDEHQKPPPSSDPHLRGSLLSKDDSTRRGRSGRTWARSKVKAKGLRATVDSKPDLDEGARPAPRPSQSSTKLVQDVPVLASSTRRLIKSDEGLRGSTIERQRELDQHAKQLMRSENLASHLEADLLRDSGGNLATFKSFIVLKRENQALRKELAEIKQVHTVDVASAPSRKINISFPRPLRRHSTGACGIRGDFASNSSSTRGREEDMGPLVTTLPRSRTMSTGQKAPLSAVYRCERASSITGKGKA